MDRCYGQRRGAESLYSKVPTLDFTVIAEQAHDCADTGTAMENIEVTAHSSKCEVGAACVAGSAIFGLSRFYRRHRSCQITLPRCGDSEADDGAACQVSPFRTYAVAHVPSALVLRSNSTLRQLQ